MPTVSVVIPTYNRAQIVLDTVDSVLAQTYRDFELIVVDDGSTDNTRETLQKYGDRIRYVYKENGGVSDALNYGINLAEGEWIGILGSDDTWLPQKLEIQMRDIAAHPGIVLHTTNAMTFRKHLGNSEKNYFQLVGYPILKDEFRIIERPLENQVVFGLAWAQCALVRRDALEKSGLFDRQMSLYEDQDLYCRLALEGNWAVRNTPLARIERKGDPEENLSQKFSNAPIEARTNFLYSYSKLLTEPRLTSREKWVLHHALAEQKSDIAFEYIHRGNLPAGRRELRDALHHEFSFKTVAKYLAAYLPAGLSLRLRSGWQTLRQRNQ
ncbi:MAG TPA: glycosyltransferase [Candidatus Sumerlaeota bacterium]|nr:glycosyltransferase [Candidatus Sumerlaeota bacterium]